MTDEPVVIVSLGASTCVGRSARSSAAAVRAGVSGFTQHPYMIDTAGEPMRVAVAPWLDVRLSGVERLGALLLPALEEALMAAENLPLGSIRSAFALCIPDQRPGVSAVVGSELAKTVSRKFNGCVGTTAVFRGGHASFLVALEMAVSQVRNGALDACLIAAVDSYIDNETLDWLEKCDQLHGAGPLNNAWGFIPGEAASAVLVMSMSSAEAYQLKVLGTVRRVGIATEPNRIKTDAVCIGQGLTQAFRTVLADLPPHQPVTDVYCDLNGEPYRADEYGFACLRTRQHFIACSDFWAPADCWGDVGAAGGGLHVMMACLASRLRYAAGPTALIWASGESGERAAAVLDTREEVGCP